jgi:hypothetical protein
MRCTDVPYVTALALTDNEIFEANFVTETESLAFAGS